MSCGADARIDLAMPIPWEFLTSEMWYCTNCCRNPLFQQVLKEIRDLPVLSNMIIMERLCPAIGVNPIPRVKDYSATILPNTAKKLLRPMKWVYDRPLTTLVRQAHNYRADVPIKAGPATVVTIIGDKLFIIPPFDSNAGVLEVEERGGSSQGR